MNGRTKSDHKLRSSLAGCCVDVQRTGPPKHSNLKIAKLHEADAWLDASSVALIVRQNQNLRDAPELLSRLVQNLERTISLDAVRNEYMLRTKLHAWFITGIGISDVGTLNEMAYTELFLAPRSDPWLGLHSPDIYLPWKTVAKSNKKATKV